MADVFARQKSGANFVFARQKTVASGGSGTVTVNDQFGLNEVNVVAKSLDLGGGNFVSGLGSTVVARTAFIVADDQFGFNESFGISTALGRSVSCEDQFGPNESFTAVKEALVSADDQYGLNESFTVTAEVSAVGPTDVSAITAAVIAGLKAWQPVPGGVNFEAIVKGLAARELGDTVRNPEGPNTIGYTDPQSGNLRVVADIGAEGDRSNTTVLP